MRLGHRNISNLRIPNDKGRCLRTGLLSCMTMKRRLEVEFRADLDSARYVSAGHLSKFLVAHGRIDSTEVGVVERVEIFTAQLEFDVLAELQVLDARQVPVLDAGSKQRPNTLSAEVACCRSE